MVGGRGAGGRLGGRELETQGPRPEVDKVKTQEDKPPPLPLG